MPTMIATLLPVLLNEDPPGGGVYETAGGDQAMRFARRRATAPIRPSRQEAARRTRAQEPASPRN